jgi:alkylation response protein AidB-like acyl-CoA dehydrogenase
MNKLWADYFEHSFLGHVYLGHFNWQMIKDFPCQTQPDKEQGDYLCKQVVQFIDEHLDETILQSEGKLPDSYLCALKKTYYTKLICDKEVGGGAFTNINAFRTLQAAFHRSIPAGLAMGVSNAFGIAALIPTLPECEFKKFVIDHVRKGILSGWADTEPSGAGNWFPSTKAVSNDGGRTFTINGDKCYIGNGSVADILIVSATIEREGADPECALFAINTQSKGFSVRRNHDFMGIDGSPIAAISLKDVTVGKNQLLETPESHWRDTLLLEPISALGRMFTVVAASSAISKKCLSNILKFQQQRVHDGRPIKHYKKIQSLTAKTAAEIFALDGVIEWCLLGSDGPLLPNRWWEQTAAKNIVSLTTTRIADRAISILGAGGYEKAESKRILGLPDFPAEQNYRDSRAFRISGGVDFLVDLQAAQRWLTAFFYNEKFDYCEWRKALNVSKPTPIADHLLCAKSVEHLNYLQVVTKNLGDLVQSIVEKFTINKLTEMQPMIILFNRIANEVFTVAVTIARARSRAGESCIEQVAEEYATEGIVRIQMLWSKLQNEIKLIDSKDSCRERIVDFVNTNTQLFCLS